QSQKDRDHSRCRSNANAGGERISKNAGRTAAEFTSAFAHRSSRSTAGDNRVALLELASSNFVRGRGFAAGDGVAAGSVCDSGRKIAQYRKGLSSFARNPRPAQFHSRADQGRTCDGVEARGNALPSYHGRGMVECARRLLQGANGERSEEHTSELQS